VAESGLDAVSFTTEGSAASELATKQHATRDTDDFRSVFIPALFSMNHLQDLLFDKGGVCQKKMCWEDPFMLEYILLDKATRWPVAS
jgi:hypothetical protein